MRKTLFLILILLISFTFAQAQDKPQAYKFNEFSNLQESQWKERLDRFAEMLISLPGSTLQIIVYAEVGKSMTSIEESIFEYRNYLYKTKKIEREKFNLRRGGFKNLQITELWIVPKNADNPTPTPIEEFKAEIFAEFGYENDEVVQAKLDGFYVKLQQVYASQGYIINYGSQKDVAKRELLIRNSIRFRCFGDARLTIVNAEGANLKTVLWIVPEGAKPPTP